MNQLFAVNRLQVDTQEEQDIVKFHQPSPKNCMELISNLNTSRMKEANKENIENCRQNLHENYFSMKFGEKFEENYFNELRPNKNHSEINYDNENLINNSIEKNLQQNQQEDQIFETLDIGRDVL